MSEFQIYIPCASSITSKNLYTEVFAQGSITIFLAAVKNLDSTQMPIRRGVFEYTVIYLCNHSAALGKDGVALCKYPGRGKKSIISFKWKISDLQKHWYNNILFVVK